MLKQLRADGWQIVRQRGAHRQLQHATKRGTVTVSGSLSQDIKIGTERSILRQAQLLEDDDEDD